MKITPEKLERLDKILSAFVETGVSPEEMVEAIDALLAVIKQNEKTLSSSIKALEADTRKELLALTSAVKSSDSEAKTSLTELGRSILQRHDQKLSELRGFVATELRRLSSLIPELPPEFDSSELVNTLADHRKLLDDIQFLITGENIRNALEALPEGDKLAISAIEGLEERLKERIESARNVTALIAHRLEQIGNVNLAGLSDNDVLSYDAATQTWVPVAPTAGSITVETPVGSVNASNTTFTVSAEPSWVVSDGITYFDGAGYSYAALSITMDVPPSQYIRAII